MLTQPQLGQTIQTLRQSKKMTQEELVEKCNVNVRTLQRIEAGEVTPRDYTIKAILAALDYEFEEVEKSITRKTALSRVQIGWIGGIIYFLMGFGETVVDFMRFEWGLPFYFPLIYTSVKVLALVAFIFFMIGFFEFGKHYKNAIIQVSAFLLMGSLAVIILYDIITLFDDLDKEEFVSIKAVEAVAFGGIDILFGIGLIRLNYPDSLARIAGIFEIISGCFFMTMILAFLGLITLIPATLLEIMLLYKLWDEFKTESID